MNMSDFCKLSDYLTSFSSNEILIVMEATGIYHLNLLSYLLEQGLNVSAVNPMFIHAFAKSLSSRKTKTDAKDAHVISIFAKRSHATIRLSTSLDLESIKPIVREKEKLTNQIFPEMLKNTNIFSKSSLNLLLQAPSKRIIRNLKERTIKRYLSDDITRGAKPKISESEILSLAKNSIGINNKSLEKILVSKIKQMFFMQSKLEEFNQLIESFVDEHHNDDMNLLTSIPGVGKPTAANKLIRIIFSMLKNNTKFESDFSNLATKGASI